MANVGIVPEENKRANCNGKPGSIRHLKAIELAQFNQAVSLVKCGNILQFVQ